MKENDNRSVCSEEKKNKIKMTKKQTQIRRQNQIVKTFECKIIEKRLNKKQHEELDMLFLEGKWFLMDIIKTDTHEFLVAVDNKNTGDMRRVISEYTNFGYKKVQEFEYEGNLVLIYAKKI